MALGDAATRLFVLTYPGLCGLWSLGAGRGIPIMLRGIAKPSLNLRDLSGTLIHMKTLKASYTMAKHAMIYGMQFAS